MRWLLCLLVVVVVAVVVAGCSHDVHTTFPTGSSTTPTGRLVLLLSQPASGVTVALNGQLVVEDAHTKRITIDGVPSGTVEITLAANGADKQFRAWVDDSHPTTVPLAVSDQSSSFWKSILATLISLTAYSLLH